MKPKPLRVAAVGAGYFSQFQFLAWKNMADLGVQLVALANRDPVKAERAAARFDIPKVYRRIDEMLDQERPDMLDIITPPETYAEYVAAATQRGIAVICQKPFGLTYSDALTLSDLAADAKVPLAVHENFRWQPWYREAHRLVENGHLGDLHNIAFRLRPGDGQGPQAYLDRQPYFQGMPRLLVYETAIHWIDTFRFLMGEVSAVYARLRRINPVIAAEDAGYIVFEFTSGAAGLFDGNRLNDHSAANPRRTMGEMWLEGSRGVVRLDGEGRLWWKPHHGAEVLHPYPSWPQDTFGGGACEWLQRHVVAHLREGAPLENSARAYLINLKVQEAVYCSHRQGCRIEMTGFDPEKNPVARTFPDC